jgi:hypothetical protein
VFIETTTRHHTQADKIDPFDIQARIDAERGFQASRQSDAKAATIGTDLSPDAEVGTNAFGGKSTKLLARFDLLDGRAIQALANECHDDGRGGHYSVSGSHPTSPSFWVDHAISSIYDVLDVARFDEQEEDDGYDVHGRALVRAQWFAHNALRSEFDESVGHVYFDGPSYFAGRFDRLSTKALFRLAEVLGYGASKYAPNNWRAVPTAEHLNHALVHLFAFLGGDTQDDHLGHAFCRIHMALAVHYQGAPWGVIDGVPQPKTAEAAA